MKLFALHATRHFATRIANTLDIELAAHEERDFSDGEFKVRALESVRGEQVFVCQSLYSDERFSVNDKLCRLLYFIGSIKDAGAAAVVALAPYLAYARKDRRTKLRDPVTTRYLASMFEAVGTDAIVTADVHNLAAFENAFRSVTENLEAATVFAAHFLPLIETGAKLVVVSPDAGGVKRARRFAELLSGDAGYPVELAFMEKHRSEGRVTGDAFAGDVAGAEVIVIDDLISGGTTMLRAAEACRERGAKAVHAAATHAVFGKETASVLAGAAISSVVVTDTLGGIRERAAGIRSKLVVLEASALFAEAVRRIAGLR